MYARLVTIGDINYEIHLSAGDIHVNWRRRPLTNRLFQRYSPFTRYNLLSIRLSNRCDNRLRRVYKHSSGCQTRLTTGLTTGCIVYTAGCQTGCTTRFDNRLNEQWLFVQLVVKPAVQPV